MVVFTWGQQWWVELGSFLGRCQTLGNINDNDLSRPVEHAHITSNCYCCMVVVTCYHASQYSTPAVSYKIFTCTCKSYGTPYAEHLEQWLQLMETSFRQTDRQTDRQTGRQADTACCQLFSNITPAFYKM